MTQEELGDGTAFYETVTDMVNDMTPAEIEEAQKYLLMVEEPTL